MQKDDFDENEDLEKIINDYYKIIKKNYIDFKIEQATNTKDLSNLQQLFEEKKQLDKIYIKL